MKIGSSFFQISICCFPVPENAGIKLCNGFLILFYVGIINSFYKERINQYSGGIPFYDEIAYFQRPGIFLFCIEMCQFQAIGVHTLYSICLLQGCDCPRRYLLIVPAGGPFHIGFRDQGNLQRSYRYISGEPWQAFPG